MSTKTQHTPGPWEVVGATKIVRFGEGGGAVAIIAEPESNDTGDIHQIGIGSKRWDEAMVNASMIAAAPWHALLLRAALSNWIIGMNAIYRGQQRIKWGAGIEVDPGQIPPCPDVKTFERIRKAVDGG